MSAASLPESVLWSPQELGAGMRELGARAFGSAAGGVGGAAEIPKAAAPDAIHAWLDAAGRHVGLEVEPFEPRYGEAPKVVAHASPAILTVSVGAGRRYLLLTRGGKRPRLLDRRLRAVSVAAASLVAALRLPAEAPFAPEIDRLCDTLGLSGRKRCRVRAELLDGRLGSQRLEMSWMVRSMPEASTLAHGARTWRLAPLFFASLAARVGQTALLVAAFWVLGEQALRAQLSGGWMAAFAMLIGFQVPLRIAELGFQSRFATQAGALLKQRLLAGALRLEPDEVKTDGAGRHFSRVVEADELELQALGAAVGTVASLVDWATALVILALSATGWAHALALVVWTALVVTLGVKYGQTRSRWNEQRLRLTEDLVEQMLGHRTRLAQEAPSLRHRDEDAAVSAYHAISRRMDGRGVLLETLPATGWLALSIAAMIPGLLAGTLGNEGLAVVVGASILALRFFREVGSAAPALAAAWASWRSVRPLFAASWRHKPEGEPALALLTSERRGSTGHVLEARELGFSYAEGRRSILDGCSFDIRSGERVLLQGSSGSGKSTLAAILTGMRSPTSGVLLFDGLDRASVGAAAWTSRVVTVPQFHDNHVLAAPLALNLLMGRRWPPRRADMALAEQVCRELGLGELLDRMPSGLMQLVGESGWRLSHGERSRVFIARALLQGADLVVFDESFAALDPATLEVALRCATARASSLLVVAHP